MCSPLTFAAGHALCGVRGRRGQQLRSPHRETSCENGWLTIAQSAALLQAIKDYENNKWKVIGQKVGKPAKVRAIHLYLRLSTSPWDFMWRVEVIRSLTLNRPVSSSQKNKGGKYDPY